MTSDERREVAERLRDEANGFRRNRAYRIRTEIDLGDVPGVFQDMTHFCGLHGMVRCEDMLDRLADLIDPTCELSVRVVKPEEFENYTCLSCGASWINYDTEPDGSVGYGWAVWRDGAPVDVRYCPYCGARVIR